MFWILFLFVQIFIRFEKKNCWRHFLLYRLFSVVKISPLFFFFLVWFRGIYLCTDDFLSFKYLLLFWRFYFIEIVTCVQIMCLSLNYLFYLLKLWSTDIIFTLFEALLYLVDLLWGYEIVRKGERDCVIWLLEIMGKSFNENPTIPYGLQYPHSP